MPNLSPFARHGLDGASDEGLLAPEALPPALPGSPRKLSRRHSLLNSLKNRWRKPQDQAESLPQFVLDNEYTIEEEKRLSLGRRSSNPELVAKGPRRVIPSLPRPQTFHRQESEKRERLLEVPSNDWGRRAASTGRRRGWSVGGYRRPRSPKSFPFPRVYAPVVALDAGKGIQNDEKALNGHDASSGQQDASNGDHDKHASHDSHDAIMHYDGMQVDECNDEDEDQAALHREFERRWILNLSMSFRDKSQREKFFVTFAETPTKWRRLTVSLDYRSAPEGSLEADVKSLHYQRDKSFRIYEAIRESLGDIQYYDTVTNLKLETTEDDGQLHVHVREDANEIVQWPAASLMDHVDCPRYTESEVEFESHLSGFVYKVRVDGRLLIKKEIPGPDTVDEFLYEVNALDALYGEDHVVQLQGLITDDYGGIVKGLLISYASRGALVDMLYDYSGELSWHRREKWAYQIVQGLSAIHEAGFVQGDFTLSNIVIDEFDNTQIVDINRRGCPVGWEPPELGKLIDSGQRIGMHISVKTDLYQLGMVLWALAEQVDEPERSRPLLPLRREVPGYFRYIVDSCLHERPQRRANASQLLRSFPRDAGRPPIERPSVDFRASPTRIGDLKTSDPSLTTSHRSDKEYIDPKMAVTIDEVQRQRRMHDRPSAFITDHVTYVDPMDSNPASTSYHFESSGSWIVGHSRGRSPVSSRRRRSSPCDRASTSATSLSCSPDHGSRRSAKVYLNEDDDEKECYPANISQSDLGPSPLTRPRSPSPVLVDKRLAEVREQNQSTASFAPPMHQDSGFDESMLEYMHLEDTIVPSTLQLNGDPRIDPGTPTEEAFKNSETLPPPKGPSSERQDLPKPEEVNDSSTWLDNASPVFGRYKLYKKGTDTLLQWLVETASTCCDVNAITGVRRKGFEQYTLATGDWLKLAKKIETAGAEVPHEILRITAEVIRGREAAAKWYGTQRTNTSTNLSPDDDGHLSFIDVLKEIHRMLSSLPRIMTAESAAPKPTRKIQQHAPAERSSGPEVLSNLFNPLQLEEPHETSDVPTASSSEINAAIASAKGDKPEQRKTERDSRKAEEDTTFAIWCLLEDLDAIRACIRASWQEYADGNKSLAVASSIADAGFRFMRRVNGEFGALYGDLGYWPRMLDFLGLVIYEGGNNYRIGPPATASKIDGLKLLCTDAAVVLNEFAQGVDGVWPIQSRHPTRLSNTTSRWHGFGSLLLEHLPDFCNMKTHVDYAKAHMKGDVPKKLTDEFVGGLVDIVTTLRMKVWMTVACQTYMDIYDIVNGATRYGLAAFESSLQDASDTEMLVEWHCERDPTLRELMLRMCGPDGMTTAQQIRRMINDTLYPEIQSVEAINRASEDPWTIIMSAFTVSPATAMRTQMFNSQRQAQVLLNAGSLVLSMAHLYKAGRHWQVVDTWEDMDFLLSTHTASRRSSRASVPIVSKPNNKSDPGALVRQFALAIGISPEVERTGSIRTANNNVLVIQYKSPLLNALIQMQKNCKVLGGGTESFTDTALSALCEAHQKTAKGSGGGHKQRPVLTPVALLSSLETQLIRDEPTLHFDYVSFYTLCQQLSLTILKIVPPEPGSRGQASFMFETLSILQMAADDIVRHRAKTAEETQDALKRSNFGKIAHEINLICKSHGNRCSKAAFEKSSNHIPKHLRPSFRSQAYQATVKDVLDEGDDYTFANMIPMHAENVIEPVE